MPGLITSVLLCPGVLVKEGGLLGPGKIELYSRTNRAEILSIHSFQPSSICSVREGKGFLKSVRPWLLHRALCRLLCILLRWQGQRAMHPTLRLSSEPGVSGDLPTGLSPSCSYLADLKTLLHLTAETEDKKQGQTWKGLTPGPTSYPVQD